LSPCSVRAQVYYESGQVTKEAQAYHDDAKVLHHNHPLELMVSAGLERVNTSETQFPFLFS